MPFLASAVRASDPFPATSVGAPEISVSGNLCATKLSAGKLILDCRTDGSKMPVPAPCMPRPCHTARGACSRAVRTVHESHNELAGYGAEEGSCVWFDELGGLVAESSPVREERRPND